MSDELIITMESINDEIIYTLNDIETHMSIEGCKQQLLERIHTKLEKIHETITAMILVEKDIP